MRKPPSISATMAKSEEDWCRRVSMTVGQWLIAGKPEGLNYFQPGLERTVAALVQSGQAQVIRQPYVCRYCGSEVQPPLSYHEGPEDCRCHPA